MKNKVSLVDVKESEEVLERSMVTKERLRKDRTGRYENSAQSLIT